MDEYTEYNGFEKQSIKEKIKGIWYNKKKYIIVLACVILVLLVVLIVTVSIKNKTPNKEKYKDIESIMLINAQKYIENNKIEKDRYIPLNNLNLKIDDELKCNTLSGVYFTKEKDNYYPYLICEGYKSNTIEEVIEENKRNKEYGELKGDNPYVVNDSTYQEEGIKSSSNYQVNIKDNDIENGLNIITYYLNKNGKYAGELKRIVIVDNEQSKYPTLELEGNKVRTIVEGGIYKESGYKAHDEEDGDITSAVIVTGNVNTNKEGTYKLIYSVTNSKNKTATAERTIIVTRKNIDLNVSHTLNPTTLTNKQVTINLKVSGNGFKYIILPDNTESSFNEVSYIVSKSDTYDFVIYDKNNNSEVYSVNVNNVDTTPPSVNCTATYEKGSTEIKIVAKDNSAISTYEYIIDGKSYKSSKKSYSYSGKAESVEVRATDKAGNTGSKTCEVSSPSIIVGKNCKATDITVDVVTCFLGKLIDSNIPLEEYMMGTVYGEEGANPATNPEFYKAFIIFARSYTLDRGGWKNNKSHLRLKTCSSDQNWCDYQKGCYREQTQDMFEACMKFSIDRASYNGGKPYYTAETCANRVTTFPGSKSVGPKTYYVPSSVTSSPIWPSSYSTSATGTHNTSRWHPPISESNMAFLKKYIEETAGLVLMDESGHLLSVNYHLCSSKRPACYNDTDSTMYPDIALELANQGATMEDLIKKYTKKYQNVKIGCISDLVGVK